MRMIYYPQLRRIAVTAAAVLAAAVLSLTMFSCAGEPATTTGSTPEQAGGADLPQSSESGNAANSVTTQASSDALPSDSSDEESGEDEVIVYEHTDATRYRSPVDTMDVTWKLLDDNEVRITSEKQEAVYAAEAGQVVVRKKTGDNAPLNYVKIDHGNGTETLYRHLDNFAVEFEERGEKGQKIAEMQEANGHYSFRFSIRRYIGENLEINIPSE